MSGSKTKSAQFAPVLIGPGAACGSLDPQAVGSKAALLGRMSALGLRVPPAFVMPTALCRPINEGRDHALEALVEGLREGVHWLETATGRRLGDPRRPLLVSVRSGAARSMPGMLSTILDVGLNLETVHGLIQMTGDPRMAWDSYRRFIQGYAEVVGDASAAPFEAQLNAMIHAEQAAGETELDPEALERLSRGFLALAQQLAAKPIPDAPLDQLLAAAQAVYRSWDGPRSTEYRHLNHIKDLSGTAVTVQAMVFGNTGGGSGAGVAFTRSPATGEPQLYVDFLFDAQGEDVVSGRRTPGDAAALARRLPDAARDLAQGGQMLERELADVQDIEFTVEFGQLYFLQTRPAKRTPRAALRTAVDLVREGVIDAKQGLSRVEEINLEHAGVARFVGQAQAAATAVPASSGVASGLIAFDSASAARLADQGEPVILVRHETSTDDIAGFSAAGGILTAVGGRTAHAAVVARQLGKVCLVGCASLVLDGRGGARLGEAALKAGDWLSLDGESGEVFLGRRDIVTQRPEAELAEIETWRKPTVAT